MDRYGRTHLFIAAQQGNVELCEMLLDGGSSANEPNRNGLTPLHAAAKLGRRELCKLLLDRGAHVNAAPPTGYMPAASNQATFEDLLHIFTRLATFDEPARGGLTPLHVASEKGFLEVCKLLLDRGAHVSDANSDGDTPLHLAAYNGLVDVCKLLLDRGASLDARDNVGRTPLHDAALRRQLQVCKFLVERGADPLAQDRYARTPIELAVELPYIRLGEGGRTDHHVFVFLFTLAEKTFAESAERYVERLARQVHLNVPVRAFLSLKFPKAFWGLHDYKISSLETIHHLAYAVQTTMPKLPRRLALKIVFRSHVTPSRGAPPKEILEVISAFMNEPLAYFQKIKDINLEPIKKGLLLRKLKTGTDTLSWRTCRRLLVAAYGVPPVWTDVSYWTSPSRSSS